MNAITKVDSKGECVAQVTTLLSKAEQLEGEPRVTQEEIQALEAQVSAQGSAVAEAKAVSPLHQRCGFCRSDIMDSHYEYGI